MVLISPSNHRQPRPCDGCFFVTKSVWVLVHFKASKSHRLDVERSTGGNHLSNRCSQSGEAEKRFKFIVAGFGELIER
ncbi:hypothetical protein L596_010494 [Steinernema carpocapsae]|uniref:Uncharacterized protein n=1 Tax=Steinernema carpocapsae TaxID=34508 RepID=A0A4U5PJV2_STECR|nr:hypothetical protein L596_010494 [Steinernema carpocapsae]